MHRQAGGTAREQPETVTVCRRVCDLGHTEAEVHAFAESQARIESFGSSQIGGDAASRGFWFQLFF